MDLDLAISKLALIDRHIAAFKENEQSIWDEIRDWYNGKFWTQRTGESEFSLFRTSLNLVFAITETASASLIAANPQVTAVSRQRTDEEAARRVEAYVNTNLDLADFREEQTLAIQDAVLFGRAVYKTTWDKATGFCNVRALDPRIVFFDLTARRPKDIRYWVEVTLMSEEEFTTRLERNKYEVPEGYRSRQGSAYPEWLIASNKEDVKNLKSWQPWVIVYEFHDLERNIVTHWLPGLSTPLMEDKLIYNPYTLLTLNSNVTDCRGLSEILLVKPNIEELNRTLTYIHNIVRLSVPRIAYDNTAVGQEAMQKYAQAEVGTYLGMKTNGRDFSKVFAAFPYPEVPPFLVQYIDRIQGNVAFISALADAARGQATGNAKTATELALMEAMLKTRLGARRGKLDKSTAEVAEKILFLSGQFLTGIKEIQVTSNQVSSRQGEQPTPWIPLDNAQLQEANVSWKVVPFSPIEQNRMVAEERFLALLEHLATRSGFDQREVDREIVEQFRLNPRLLLPLEALQAQQQAATAPAVPGAPMSPEIGMPPEAEPSSMPPAQAAFSDAAAAGMADPLGTPPAPAPGLQMGGM